jgi:AcrR family transcriptional regulator
LVVRIGTRPRKAPASDLTARARIRDAAIECFAEQGFDTPFRTIAARAQVSPGLITHHFGSKTALREECDAEILRRYTTMKSEGVAEPRTALLRALGPAGMSASLVVYMLRAIHAGGEGARAFLENLVEDLRPIMAESVASGLVRPSRDEEARLRLLVNMSMGAILVQFMTSPGLTPQQFLDSLSDPRRPTFLPLLELYTEGLMTSSELLDTYLSQTAPRAHRRPIGDAAAGAPSTLEE